MKSLRLLEKNRNITTSYIWVEVLLETAKSNAYAIKQTSNCNDKYSIYGIRVLCHSS
jgi:hypothetical protein